MFISTECQNLDERLACTHLLFRSPASAVEGSGADQSYIVNSCCRMQSGRSPTYLFVRRHVIAQEWNSPRVISPTGLGSTHPVQ